MNIQFFILTVAYFLSDVFVLALLYKLFIKYRYNHFFKINLEEMHDLNGSEYICGADPMDMIYDIGLVAVVAVLQYFLSNYVLFNDRSDYLYFRYIPMFGYLPYIFPFFVCSALVTSYIEHKDRFEKYLYYECFMYKGRRPKLYYDNPKFRKPYITDVKKGDIITQAQNEKKSVKIYIAICALLILVIQPGVLFELNCFTKDEIKIAYSQYEYDDVTAIYKARKYKPLIGSVINENYTTLVFNDGRTWNDRNKERLSDEIIDYIVEKTGLKPVSYEFLPDKL